MINNREFFKQWLENQKQTFKNNFMLCVLPFSSQTYITGIISFCIPYWAILQFVKTYKGGKTFNSLSTISLLVLFLINVFL